MVQRLGLWRSLRRPCPPEAFNKMHKSAPLQPEPKSAGGIVDVHTPIWPVRASHGPHVRTLQQLHLIFGPIWSAAAHAQPKYVQKKPVPCSFDQNAPRYKVFGTGYLTDGIVGASCAIQNRYM